MHETFHLKESHFSLEAEKRRRKTTSKFIEGVSVRTSQKTTREGSPHTHFVGLHEAIVSEQTRKSLKRMMELPYLKKKEKEHMRSEKTMETVIRRISGKIKNTSRRVLLVK